jgi:hypothetical protein
VYRKVTGSIKSNEQKRGQTKKLPTDEQGAEISRPNGEYISKPKEQNGTIESLKSLFSVHI